MHVVATLAEHAVTAGLPFLVIGGQAVIAYGYPRYTVDVDLLVRETDRRAWDEVIVQLGYRAHQIQRAFHMYNPIPRALPPIDLMLVDGGTFTKLQENSQLAVIGGAKVQIPTLLHLIALKLHALHSGREHRRELDLGDVVTLIQLNKVDLASPDYQQILDRYATDAVRAELERRLAGPQPPGA